jgi:hypothetical protein
MTLFPDGLDQETLDVFLPILRSAATLDMQEQLEEVLWQLTFDHRDSLSCGEAPDRGRAHVQVRAVRIRMAEFRRRPGGV